MVLCGPLRGTKVGQVTLVLILFDLLGYWFFSHLVNYMYCKRFVGLCCLSHIYFLDDTKFKNEQIKTPLNGGNLVIFFFLMTSCMSLTNFCHFPSLACHLSLCLGDFFSSGLRPTLIFFFSFFSVLEIDSSCVSIPEIYWALPIMACATMPGLIFLNLLS